ncbi:hypothetical protein [Sporomusa aerivorans]|uniref:pyocin knob domain-containing protein n=1 Tax=Sporomusa aerivorans TaxID=204936 RepID=UPI00352B7AD8
MSFEYGEQRDAQGNITHAGSWGVKSSPKEAFEAIIENFRVLKDEGVSEEVLHSYVDGAIAELVNGSPEALDTLYELANALGNDPDFSATVLAKIGQKANQATTLAGYGITDAYTKTESDAKYSFLDKTISNVRVLKDVARIFSSNIPVTGTLKITIPISWNNAMMRIVVSGFNHSSSTLPWNVTISGYNASAGSGSWNSAAVSALLSPGCPFTSVRFGHDGANCCILLGVTSTAWHYPAIKIDEVQLSFNGMSGIPATGWTLSYITDETGITISGSPIIKTLSTIDYEGIDIAAGTDLNNLTTPGDYRSNSNTITASLLNVPVSVTIPFTLQVTKINATGYATQVLTTTHPSTAFQRFVRNQSGGSWGSWYEELFKDNTLSSVRVLRDLARIYNGSSTVTGTLKITIPYTWSGTMLRILVSGFNYIGNELASWDAVLNGYNPGSSWGTTGLSALLSPSCPFTSVRFGHDGTNCCILLGTTTTTWNYPAIKIDEVQLSHTNNQTIPAAGWTLSFITDETGITMSTSSNTPVVKTALSNDSNISGVRVLRDVARSYNSNAVTGALKISLPSTTVISMMKLTVSGYSHVASPGSAWDAILSGYVNTGTSKWECLAAILSPNCPFTSVRFAHDGTNYCILLGTTATVWSYPSINIPEVQVSFNGVNYVPATGWSLSFITSETGVTFPNLAAPQIKTLTATNSDGVTDNTISSVRVLKDIARYFYNNTITGTIKITIPTTWNSTMMRFKITGYNYSNSPASVWEANITGYNYSGGSQWIYAAATLSPNCPFTSVRFGHDGTNCCILLGITTTFWSYPSIKIDEVQLTAGGTSTFPSTGFTISLITDETGITFPNAQSPQIRTLAALESPTIIAPTFSGGTYVDTGDLYIRSASSHVLRFNTGSTNLGYVGVIKATTPYLAMYNVTGSAGINVYDTGGVTINAATSVSLSGGQLAFPPTQKPASDPNTLDDYEEGTFTPYVYGTTTAGTGTYSVQSGVYTKIGNVVYFHLAFSLSAHTGTGNMRIGGLPFTVNSSYNPACSLWANGLTFTGSLVGVLSGGSTNLFIYQMASTATEVAMDTSNSMVATGFYYVS